MIKEAPKGFSIYSGDDPTAVALYAVRRHGNVSVTANVAPALMHELCMAAIAGDVRNAMDIQMRLLPAQGAVRRIESDPREMGRGPHGHVRRGAASAADQFDRAESPRSEQALRGAGLL